MIIHVFKLSRNTMSEIQTIVREDKRNKLSKVASCTIKFNCYCLLQAKCKRTGPGNYSCHCNSGFIGDGYFCLGSVVTVDYIIFLYYRF